MHIHTYTYTQTHIEGIHTQIYAHRNIDTYKHTPRHTYRHTHINTHI